jgi:hypothetical protein
MQAMPPVHRIFRGTGDADLSRQERRVAMNKKRNAAVKRSKLVVVSNSEMIANAI